MAVLYSLWLCYIACGSPVTATNTPPPLPLFTGVAPIGLPQVVYHSGSSSILIVGDDGSVGQRRPYSGILLLQSALQLPVFSLEEYLTLDILYAEVGNSNASAACKLQANTSILR